MQGSRLFLEDLITVGKYDEKAFRAALKRQRKLLARKSSRYSKPKVADQRRADLQASKLKRSKSQNNLGQKKHLVKQKSGDNADQSESGSEKSYETVSESSLLSQEAKEDDQSLKTARVNQIEV